MAYASPVGDLRILMQRNVSPCRPAWQIFLALQSFLTMVAPPGTTGYT
jgi:hypothetical protein